MPKQLVNVIGVVVVVAILALGIALIALPMYLQSLSTSAQTAQVAQTNDVYQAQVDQLRVEEERFDEITADVATLQTQIPPAMLSDDVFEIVAKAAEAAGVMVVSVSASEPVAWGSRTGAASSEAQATPTDPAIEGDDETVPTGPAVVPAAAGQAQVPFSISISTDDSAKAAAFLDQLGMGPRLIGIVSSTLTASDSVYALDVAALSFVRAGA